MLDCFSVHCAALWAEPRLILSVADGPAESKRPRHGNGQSPFPRRVILKKTMALYFSVKCVVKYFASGQTRMMSRPFNARLFFGPLRGTVGRAEH